MKLYTVNTGNSREKTLNSHVSPLSVFILLLLSFTENGTYARRKYLTSPPDLQFEPRWSLEMLSVLLHFGDD